MFNSSHIDKHTELVLFEGMCLKDLTLPVTLYCPAKSAISLTYILYIVLNNNTKNTVSFIILVHSK
jgi:hypothetical protein